MKKTLFFSVILACSTVSTSLFGMLVHLASPVLKRGQRTPSVRHHSSIACKHDQNKIIEDIQLCSKHLDQLEQSTKNLQEDHCTLDIHNGNTFELDIDKVSKESKKISQHKLRARGLFGYARVVTHLCSTIKQKTQDWNRSDVILQSHLMDLASIDYIVHGITCDLRSVSNSCHDLEMIVSEHQQWAAKNMLLTANKE